MFNMFMWNYMYYDATFIKFLKMISIVVNDTIGDFWQILIGDSKFVSVNLNPLWIQYLNYVLLGYNCHGQIQFNHMHAWKFEHKEEQPEVFIFVQNKPKVALLKSILFSTLLITHKSILFSKLYLIEFNFFKEKFVLIIQSEICIRVINIVFVYLLSRWLSTMTSE